VRLRNISTSADSLLSVIKGCHVIKGCDADRTVTDPLKTSFARFARSSMPPKTGPIPQEVLEPGLYSSGMTAQFSARYCAAVSSGTRIPQKPSCSPKRIRRNGDDSSVNNRVRRKHLQHSGGKYSPNSTQGPHEAAATLSSTDAYSRTRKRHCSLNSRMFSVTQLCDRKGALKLCQREMRENSNIRLGAALPGSSQE
jgi:hypothetical protein